MFTKGSHPETEFKKGHKTSEAVRKKMRDNHADVSGKNNPNYGKHHTPEAMAKIRKARERQFGENNPFWNKHHTSKLKEKLSIMAKTRTGNKNAHWKGGKTPLFQSIRNLDESKQWRSDVFQRDNWTCQTCGLRCSEGKAVYLEAHHIKEFAKIIRGNNIKNVIEAQLCKELWDIDNGVTLCEDCHKLTRKGARI